MAKDNRGGGHEKGHIEIRLLEIKLDGNDATLQDGLRALTSALGRNAPAPRVTTPARRPATLNGSTAHDDGTVQSTETDDGDDLADGDDSTGSDVPAKPPRKRTITVPKVDTSLDLSGDKPFQEFSEALKPKSDQQKFLAIAAWLKDARQLDINMSRAYTCFQLMRWQRPKDMMQPVRQMATDGWFKRSGKGTYAITQVGENEVLKMKKKADRPSATES